MAICQWILLLLIVFRTGVGCAKEKTGAGILAEFVANVIIAVFIWACGAFSTIFGIPWEMF